MIRFKQYKATGKNDRWFIRAHNIREIPKEGGIPLPTKNGVTHHKDIDSYVAAEKNSRPRFHENMMNWLKNNKGHKNYGAAHAFVKEHYPHILKKI